MALTLREIRQNTTAARKLIRRTHKEKFGVGAFNLDNQETLKAVARAALAKRSPVIAEISQASAESIGLDNLRDMVNNYKDELELEIYLSLAHSPTVEDAVAAIEAGFEFVDIDIYQSEPDASEEEIIKKTRMVVNYARLTGALVESEPHYFRQAKRTDYEEVKKTFSSPERAKKFIENTGIDIYAASVGNLHGKFRLPKLLDLGLLKQIKAQVNQSCSLSLHEGSGTPDHYFKDAVIAGVSKVSVDSDMRIAFRDALEKALHDNPEELALSKLMDEAISAVQRIVEEKIDLFGSEGKART